MAPKHPDFWIWQASDWPNFTWDASSLSAPLALARRAQGEARGATHVLDRSMHVAAQLETLTLEGIATSAIEGEAIDPDALRSSLTHRLGLSSSNLAPASRSVDGLTEVMLDATQQYENPLTLERLCAWQAALFPTGRSGLHRIRIGELRGNEPMRIVSGPIERERVHFIAPSSERLNSELLQFLAWFNDPPRNLDGLIRAGLAHAWFEVIHPFEDGNGRVGRALLDRALAQDELRSIRLYSLSARLMSVRDQYYAALEGLSRGGLDVTPWLVWFLEQFTVSVKNSEQTIGQVLRKARFWVRHAQSPLNERQRKALNSMLDAVAPGCVGGMTNRKYANLTKISPATAQRDLAELVQLGCVDETGGGRSARYILPSTPGVRQ